MNQKGLVCDDDHGEIVVHVELHHTMSSSSKPATHLRPYSLLVSTSTSPAVRRCLPSWPRDNGLLIPSVLEQVV